MKTVVVLAGPDGVGKTTLARALMEARPDAIRVHGHRRAAGADVPVTDPHSRPPYGPMRSLAKLALLYLRHLLSFRPDGLTIVERHFLDISVDPRRYRVGLPSAVPRTLALLLPRPDLSVLLDLPAEQAHARKPELNVRELDRQLAEWRGISHRRGWLVLDATLPPVQLRDAVLARLEAASMMQRLLGSHSPSGQRHVIVTRRGEPRFGLPGRRGPWRAGLYRPARAWHRVPALALEVVRPGRRLLLDTRAGAAPVVAAALGLQRVELAAATKAGGHRTLLAVHSGGRLVAFAKAGDVNPGGLEREHAILTCLSARTPAFFATPEPLALLDWEGTPILVLAPIRPRGRADRPLGAAELDALTELALLGSALAPALGTSPGLVPVHGDFAAWNCSRAGSRVLLWDWEEARLGLPLEDYFHWRMLEVVHFGRGHAADVVVAATRPDAAVRELCLRLNLDDGAPPAALRAYLTRGIADKRLEGTREPALAARRQALALLEAA